VNPWPFEPKPVTPLSLLRSLLPLFGVILLLQLLPDWLIETLLGFAGLLLLLPVVGFFGFRWWLRRNLVVADCPVCGSELQAFRQAQTQCPNCGELLQVSNGGFERVTPPGTLDVQVVDVTPLDD
jgi:ribosomal protein S27E